MHRVVLADIDKTITDTLLREVRWEDFDCRVAGIARSTGDAARLIREQAPQVLITDIRMPDGDSLTMLAGLRSDFPDLQVTILTKHRDFDCAREAIRLGVARYLLKPSGMKEIREAIQVMTERVNRKENAAEEEQGRHAGSFVVNQALYYMEKNHRQKLTLQTVAQSCYVSQWHLSKLLNRHVGKSFYDILNGIRIRRAKELLADPKLMIGQIAEMVGYADTAHFARTFKKLEGMSANEYRNILR